MDKGVKKIDFLSGDAWIFTHQTVIRGDVSEILGVWTAPHPPMPDIVRSGGVKEGLPISWPAGLFQAASMMNRRS